MVLNRLLDLVRRLRPDRDRGVVALLVGNQPHLVLILNFADALVGRLQQRRFLIRHMQVVDGDGDAGARGVVESQVLDLVHDLSGVFVAELFLALRDDGL